MIVDIIFLILLALAVIKGISRGFVVAVFSFFAIIIGVAAAMKLSFIVANWLQNSFNINGKWLPILSFIIVLVGVIFLVRWIANIIQAALNITMLGWLNKLGGVILYLCLYLFVYSIFLFYLTKMHIIKAETIKASRSYSLIEPFGPTAIDLISYLIPIFKNIFQQLSDFFGTIASNKT
ncbi:MAG: CvpA family protein [Parafilimonas sp.]|nr:CvpA family protein [Parafilimonas sp.]